MTRFFIRLLNYTLLACFFTAVWGGWYLSKQGFGRKWRKKLSEEFARRGVELTARRLTLDPMRGLVARNVRVYRDANHQDTVAVIDELRLDINYTRLLRNEPFLDALSLNEAEVRLDVDPRRARSGEFTIQHLAVQVNLTPEKWEIRRFQGEGLGLHFAISGVIEHRPDLQPVSKNAATWQVLDQLAKDWLEPLAEIQFGKKRGHLELRFRGNLAQRSWLQSAEGHLDLPQLRWRGIQLRNLSADADFSDRLLTIRRVSWRDDHGAITVSGEWQPGKQGHLNVDSAINPAPIFHELNLLPGLTSAKQIGVRGDWTWKEKPQSDWQIVGQLDSTDLVYHDAKWDHAAAAFSITPNRWLIQDAEFQQKESALSGQWLNDHGHVTAEITSTIDPHVLWATAGREAPPWLSDFNFAAHPLLKARIANGQTDGEIVLGRTDFRGVALTSAQASFSRIGGGISLNQIQITRPEGQTTGEAFWNADRNELTFWDVKNSIDLAAVGLWLDRSLADAWQTVALPRGTILQADGRARWAENQLAEIRMELRSDAFPLWELPLFASLPRKSPALHFAASASLENHIFRLAPFAADNARISGTATWDLQSHRFTGEMTDSATTWTADSPWPDIRWHPR